MPRKKKSPSIQSRWPSIKSDHPTCETTPAPERPKATRLTYAERLRDPRWQRKRLEIMGRDNFTCRECCATEKTLNVHHKFYMRGKQPWDYPDYMLITLCEDCHEDREEAMVTLNMSLIHATTAQLIRFSKRVGEGIPVAAVEPPQAKPLTTAEGMNYFKAMREALG